MSCTAPPTSKFPSALGRRGRISHSLIISREVLILTCHAGMYFLIHPLVLINDERMAVHCLESGCIGLYTPSSRQCTAEYNNQSKLCPIYACILNLWWIFWTSLQEMVPTFWFLSSAWFGFCWHILSRQSLWVFRAPWWSWWWSCHCYIFASWKTWKFDCYGVSHYYVVNSCYGVVPCYGPSTPTFDRQHCRLPILSETR